MCAVHTDLGFGCIAIVSICDCIVLFALNVYCYLLQVHSCMTKNLMKESLTGVFDVESPHHQCLFT
jgi:hypothetical protein